MCLPKFDFYQGTVAPHTAQKMKFSIMDFFSKDVRIWSPLLKKSLMENFIFRAVAFPDFQAEIHLVRRNMVSTGRSIRA